jgi:geranylgeranyl pyrophosphate synthase
VKPAPLADAPTGSLLQWLQARARAGSASELPERLWEPALHGPLRDFLTRPGKASRARMVELAYCVAGGAAGTHPPELPLLVESLHAGSLIIDDIEDDSEMRRGAPTLHRTHGVPIALNAGNWLYFHALELLGRMPMASESAKLRAFEHTSSCLLRCHEGQALDLSARVNELARDEVAVVAATIARNKTGGLLALGMGLSALCAGGDGACLRALSEFGAAVGTCVQMLDDLSGLVDVRRRAKAIEDLRQARPTWLWAWLAQEASEEHYRACQLRLRAVMRGDDPGELLEALRFRVVAPGRACIRRGLVEAIAALRSELGERPALHAFERQLAMLEPLYLGAEG